MEKPVIGITTGDLNGIGLETIIKTFSDARMTELCTPVLFASNKVVNFYRKTIADINFNFYLTKDFTKLNHKQLNLFGCWEEEVPLQPGVLTDLGGKYAIRSLEVATQCLKDGEIEALVTAPIHKNNTQNQDFPYTGHTPFFKDKFAAKDVLMLLYNEVLRVGLVTEHVPITEVAPLITAENINAKLTLLKETLVRDFGIDKPRIAVLGLNPHAGDGGNIGKEEQTIIRPVVEKWQQKGALVYGPYSADAFFARSAYKEFDATLAMYHDQGLIPFKTIAEGDGVNYTAGLPIIRTSPDHGTAFDIAGKDLADPSSLRTAVFEAIALLRQRASYDENTANPLRRGRKEKERDNA